jgi:hypothetical protein
MTTSTFKVLIAGGSLVGLTLALALEKAGIDWELFEKGDIAPQLGASIGLHPQSLRILDQLGVWEDIKRAVIPLEHRQHLDGNGWCFEDSYVLKDIYKMYSIPIDVTIIGRLTVLYKAFNGRLFLLNDAKLFNSYTTIFRTKIGSTATRPSYRMKRPRKASQ